MVTKETNIWIFATKLRIEILYVKCNDDIFGAKIENIQIWIFGVKIMSN